MKSVSCLAASIVWVIFTLNAKANAQTCQWAGHCLGATCVTGNDCSDVLDCINGVCGGVVPWTTITQVQTGRLSPTRTTEYFTLGEPTGATSCAWVGHCAGATCTTGNDCSDVLDCVRGVCG
ncbi:hypothetical protein N431DRAFT_529066 [Stipitochalara longipes BDJ]|nr:hypothetical protein N431DRAFT_529066 [Stipitochalara longipes BDJ]